MKYVYILDPDVDITKPIRNMKLYQHVILKDKLHAIRVDVSLPGVMKMVNWTHKGYVTVESDEPISKFNPMPIVHEYTGWMNRPELLPIPRDEWPRAIKQFYGRTYYGTNCYLTEKQANMLREGGWL